MWRGTLQVVPKAAQPGIAADRFAREIVRFLKASAGALAATECQPVSRQLIRVMLI
jgi:hypothetical protein